MQTTSTYAYVENSTKLLPVRVLLDSGSQSSYITNNLKRKLGLIHTKTETLNLNTFGNEKFSKRDCDLIKLRLQGKHGEDVNISALSFEAICSPVPSKVSLHEHPHLLYLHLADCISGNMDSQDNIDVLIGSDYYWDIITGEVARGDDKLVAVSSKFGWLVSGPTKGDSGTAHFTTSNLIVQKPYDFMESQNQATELAKSLNRFWDIESEDEQFLRFIKFDKDGGRYEVDLPWREQTCKQSDNFHLSVTRLDCLKAHLKKDKKLLQEYDTIFRAQLKAGIKELVPRDEEDLEGAHFPPHHGVLSEDRETKKLRIVFDGSERADKNHYSLNDCLETGPNLTPHVFEVLAKFRSYPVGLTADIEKAFHQISVNPADRDQLRFLWFKNVNMKIWCQKLCVDKVNWDDRLEGTMLAKWNHLFSEFSSLAKLNIPRCYFVRERKPVCRQLHGFRDTSEQAIAAVVYLRTVYEAGGSLPPKQRLYH